MDPCGDGGKEKRSDSRYILKVEPTGLAEEADVTNGRMRGVEHDSEWSDLSSRKEDVAL